MENAIWANQFDNLANRRAITKLQEQKSGEQTEGKVDAWVTSTGGTAGVSMYLKEKSRD